MYNKFLSRTQKYYQRVNLPSTYPILFSHDLFRNGIPLTKEGSTQRSPLNALDLFTFPAVAFYSFPNARFSSAFVSFVSSLSTKKTLFDKGVQRIRLASGPSMRSTLSSARKPLSMLDGQGYFLVDFSSWRHAVSFFKDMAKGKFSFERLSEDDTSKKPYQFLDEIFNEPEFCVVNGTVLDMNFLRRYYAYPLRNPVRERISVSFPMVIKAAFSLSLYQPSSILSNALAPRNYLIGIFWRLLFFWGIRPSKGGLFNPLN